MKTTACGLALSVLLPAMACGGGSSRGPLDEVDAIVFLERQPRDSGLGNVFAYQSYVPGARIMKLSPPTADGELTVLCCDDRPDFEEVDIIDFDVSFDAKTIVFSAKLSQGQRYGLFLLHLDTGEVDQLPTDPGSDYVYPTFQADDRVMFATNAVAEEGAPQFRDEYERAVTLQHGSIALDGSDHKLFARMLSHRTTSTVLHTGEVLLTQWDHLGRMNAGHLLVGNPDGTRLREAFGKEGTGVTNSYYKAVEASPGRIIAIGSSRDRTFQSGTVLDIRLGTPYETENGEVWANEDMAEQNASYRILTANVPLADEPSSPTIGRYYNAYPLNAAEFPDLLVSWADGPVQAEVNGTAGVAPDFGLYLYNSERGTRLPIYNNEDTWEINPLPLVARDAPPKIPEAGPNQYDENAVLVGALDVYNSSVQDFAPGSIYGIRIVEGFSGEEGIGGDFGLTRSEGAASLGIVPVKSDGSFQALIPANAPVRQIAVDKYGIGLELEPIWISGNPGESKVCGGCHEDRTLTTIIDPGQAEAFIEDPTDLMSQVGRFERLSHDYNSNLVGIPWNLALQPVFDAKCVDGCHNGTPGPANKSLTITDPETGQTQTMVFDLRGHEVDYGVGEAMLSGYSASHLSLLGPDPEDIEEAGLEVSGDMPIYVEAEDARGSILIQKLNPPKMYPTINLNDRAFDGPTHPSDVGGVDLTPEEYRMLIEMADNGGQYFSRENNPGKAY